MADSRNRERENENRERGRRTEQDRQQRDKRGRAESPIRNDNNKKRQISHKIIQVIYLGVALRYG